MEILAFESQGEFEKWLEKNCGRSEGIWLQLYKKGSGEKTISYAEALEVLLCYGWIDGQKKSHDERSFLQKLTPRRARSKWSRVNTQHVERLTKEGRMKAAGLRAVEAAKADGRWEAAYDSPGNAAAPEDFLRALGKNRKAKAFFATLDRANVYSIVYRLQTAKKAETRERWVTRIIGMLERGEKFHP